MPIRAQTLVPIHAPPAVFAAPDVTDGQILLDVPQVFQEQNEWCWAACTQMIAAFLGNSGVKQCELANFLHDQTDCCQNPGSDACNQPCPFEDVLPVYDHIGISGVMDNHAETVQVMLTELQAKRPFEVAVVWLGGGGHVVLVRGIYADGTFAVNDPWNGAGPVSYLGLLTAGGLGRWVVTYGVFRSK
jgi:hypothetical protein